MLLPFKLGLGGQQGSGKQWMSWIALDDEIGAIRAAIDDDALRGPVNVDRAEPGHATASSPRRSATCCTARPCCRRRCCR